MKIAKEVKVGLLALIAGVILYVGFNYLKGIEFFSSSDTYNVVYKNIDGLTVSNPVMLNGLSVGRVRSIDIMQKRENQLLVQLDVKEKIRVTEHTRAVLSSSDLLGGKTIVLDIKPGEEAKDGDTLLSGVEKGITETIMEKTLPVMHKMDSTIWKVNHIFDQIFNDTTLHSVRKSIDNFSESSSTFNRLIKENGKRLSAMTKDAKEMTADLNKTIKEVKPLISKLNRFADTLNDAPLAQTIKNANKAVKDLESVAAKIDSGKGSLAQLINNEGFYNNLDSAAKNLDRLIIDLEENPNRYVHFSVFGRKDKDKDKDKDK